MKRTPARAAGPHRWHPFEANAPGLASGQPSAGRQPAQAPSHPGGEVNDSGNSLSEAVGGTLGRERAECGPPGAPGGPARREGLGVLDYVLEKVDFVLMMTVTPGFAGQKVISATLREIADCRRYLDTRGFAETPIQ